VQVIAIRGGNALVHIVSVIKVGVVPVAMISSLFQIVINAKVINRRTALVMTVLLKIGDPYQKPWNHLRKIKKMIISYLK